MPGRSSRVLTAGRELDRLAGSLADLEARLDAADRSGARGPRVELAELRGRLRVTAELPGVAARSLRLELRGRELRLEGARGESREAKGEAVLLRERPQGRFACALLLPRDVDPRRARARLERGRLTIDLPEARPRARRIRVREGGAR
jgi:HSP20 family protein